jgi:membrane-associated protein
LEHILLLLSEYRYLLLFPLAIVEGPILAILAGFLCINKFLNPFIVYPIIVLGDMTGDSICYMFGRFGVPGFLKSIFEKLGVKPEKIHSVRSYFDANPNKTISLSKITLGIGFAGIYLAGITKIPYKKFIGICFVTSLLQYIVYLGIGLLFGNAYKQISHYLDLATALIITFASAILILYIVKSKRTKLCGFSLYLTAIIRM